MSELNLQNRRDRALAAMAALAAAAMALAWYQGSDEASRLDEAIAGNGNAAGVTRGQVEQMAVALAEASAQPIGEMRAVLTQLAATGAFAGDDLMLAARAAVALARHTGRSLPQVIGQLVQLRGGATQWADPWAEQWTRHWAAQATPSHDRIDAASKAAADFWDALEGIGRPRTTEQQIAGVQQQLEANRLRTDRRDTFNPLDGEMREGADRQRCGLEARLQTLQARLDDEREAAARAAAEAQQRVATASPAPHHPPHANTIGVTP